MAAISSALANEFYDSTQAAACKIPQGKYISHADRQVYAWCCFPLACAKTTPTQERGSPGCARSLPGPHRQDGAPASRQHCSQRCSPPEQLLLSLAGQERCPERGRAEGGAGPAHTQRAAGALPPAHQRDLGQPELCHQCPPCEESAGHPALPALRLYGGQTGSHPQHGSSLGSTALGRRRPSRRPGAQTHW